MPVKVTIAGGPLALTCWSTKPMAIEELGLILGANSKPCSSAILRGSPGCTNWIRGAWKLKSPLKSGEGTWRPSRLLLPCSHKAAALKIDQRVAAEMEEHVVGFDLHVDVEAVLGDVGNEGARPAHEAAGDVRGEGDRLFEHRAARVGEQGRHDAVDQRLREPAEVRQPVGHREDEQARRASRVAGLDDGQGIGERRLVITGRRAVQHDRQEQGVDRRE